MDTDKDAGRVAIESTQLLASKLQRLLVFWGDDAKRERPGPWTRVLLEKHIDEVKSILSEANADLTV